MLSYSKAWHPLELNAVTLSAMLQMGFNKREPGELTKREAARFIMQLSRKQREKMQRERDAAKPAPPPAFLGYQPGPNGSGARYQSNGSPH